MAEEERESGKVRFLLETATNSTEPEIDKRLMKSIKYVVRNSDYELKLAAQTLMDLMKRDHSQVRYLALLIIDELFMRSKLFRTQIVENMDRLLSLSIGFRTSMPLPAPASVATLLRSKAMEFLEKWYISFGMHYRHIRLGFEYLKNTLRFQFPNIQANAARIERERREREIKSQAILHNKYETLKGNISSIKDEIQLTIDEIGECLEILSTDEENRPLRPLDDDEIEEFHSSELRQIRLNSLKEGERVHENNDNKVVFDALRDLYKLLVSRHLVSVQEWISVIVRVDVTDNRLRNNMLKEFIDIQNQIQSLKKKCEESGCSILNNVNQEEEDFWEEGEVEAIDNKSIGEPNKQKEDFTIASTSSKSKSKSREPASKVANVCKGSTSSSKIDASKSSSLKMKLVDEAPVMKWGSFLDNWGSKRDVLANQRGLEFDSHWGRVDPDAVIPNEKIAELNVQATVYEEQPVEIPPCRAPLRKGAFCERRDLKVCPFHGPIVPRDDQGVPINSQVLFDLAAVSVERLAQQAVKNVRERDNEELKKREKMLKRAKLAEVRQHNDAVLRDAALASTSKSSALGEDLEQNSRGKTSRRNKKETLASMLRKKITPKDRLAQRLLNTRARDSTTSQLNIGTDTNYREAFPNQW